MSGRTAISCGALLASLAVILGAYAAHGLEQRIVAQGFDAEVALRLGWFETGVKYHMYHAVALVLVGTVAELLGSNRSLRISSLLFPAGILLFSGSLYAMTLLGEGWSRLGAITPLGGVSLGLAWILLAVGARR